MASECACAPRMGAKFSPPAGARAASGLPSDPNRRFPRSKRLLRRAEFQRVYSEGIRVVGRHVVLFAVRTDGTSRFGVTASRKVGNAVVRARSKRRLRELWRHRQTEGVLSSIDLVANARRSCARAPWPALECDFDHCLSQLGERMSTEGR